MDYLVHNWCTSQKSDNVLKPTMKIYTLKFVRIITGASLSSILRRWKARKFGVVNESLEDLKVNTSVLKNRRSGLTPLVCVCVMQPTCR